MIANIDNIDNIDNIEQLQCALLVPIDSLLSPIMEILYMHCHCFQIYTCKENVIDRKERKKNVCRTARKHITQHISDTVKFTVCVTKL